MMAIWIIVNTETAAGSEQTVHGTRPTVQDTGVRTPKAGGMRITAGIR